MLRSKKGISIYGDKYEHPIRSIVNRKVRNDVYHSSKLVSRSTISKSSRTAPLIYLFIFALSRLMPRVNVHHRTPQSYRFVSFFWMNNTESAGS